MIANHIRALDPPTDPPASTLTPPTGAGAAFAAARAPPLPPGAGNAAVPSLPTRVRATSELGAARRRRARAAAAAAVPDLHVPAARATRPAPSPSPRSRRHDQTPRRPVA